MSTAAHVASRPPIRIPWHKIAHRMRTTAYAVKVRKTTLRSATLQISGLAALSTSAWMLATPAGMATVGLSCFVLNWLLSE